MAVSCGSCNTGFAKTAEEEPQKEGIQLDQHLSVGGLAVQKIATAPVARLTEG